MRLVQGRTGWWCIAPSGVALVPARHVAGDRLTAAGLDAVRWTGITNPRPVTTYALTVLTTTACNLGCGYCFQNTARAVPGRFDPPRIAGALLDTRTVDAIVAFTRRRMADAGLTRLHVLLFGGEPLINPAACAALLRRCHTAGELTAAMISNGTLLNPRLAGRLHGLGLRSVQITLDGPRSVHDAVRATRRGRGTFDRILGAVAAAQQACPVRFTFRVNVTPAVLPRLPELVEQVAARVDATRCGLRLAQLTGAGLDPAEVLPPTREAAAQMVAGYRAARTLGFRLPRPADRRCGYCAEPDGRYGAVVNADGTLYSCWETAGRPGLEVGTVGTGYHDYPPQRWVHCATPASTSNDPAAARRFADAVDAGLLDLLLDGHGRRHGGRTRNDPAPARAHRAG